MGRCIFGACELRSCVRLVMAVKRIWYASWQTRCGKCAATGGFGSVGRCIFGACELRSVSDSG